MEDLSVEQLVERLELEAHPEGGYYRETWRSEHVLDDALPDHPGPRSAGTSILYLLPAGEVSDWHRVRSEELWVYHAGNPVALSIRETSDGSVATSVIGRDTARPFQSVVPRNWWQRAESFDGPKEWSLVGCVVVPGFEFEDFEMADDRNG